MNWVLILCLSLIFASCQSLKVKNYVTLDLEYPEYQQTLKKLDTFLGSKLRNRNEAHITVITPPEFNLITAAKIPPETIHQEWEKWPQKTFKKLCLGEGIVTENKNIFKTYYLVVETNDLLNFRQYLKNKYVLANFKADSYYPHITIGFTEKDLHFEQGVIKDQKSCPKKLQTILQQ